MPFWLKVKRKYYICAIFFPKNKIRTKSREAHFGKKNLRTSKNAEIPKTLTTFEAQPILLVLIKRERV